MDETPRTSDPTVYPGDLEVSPNPVPVVEPPHEKGRLLLHTGCLTVALALGLAIAAGLLSGLAGARLMLTGSLFGPAQQPSQAASATPVPAGEPVAVAAAAALPSVVNIDVTGSEITTSGLPKNHPAVPFAGQGSGVAYKAAPGGGTYVITNEHVVTGSTTIDVVTPGGDRVKATLVGADIDTDLAVVKVPVSIAPIALGSSDGLVVGQLVVAIGSPFGLEHSVSAGVVSGLHRSLPDSTANAPAGVYPLVDVIQTDAAINPGNSGGALVDRSGRLVGINSAIFSDSGSNAGIGFAIPVAAVVRVADQLISTGKATHPYLGVVGQTVTDSLATEKKLPVTSGALVIEVQKGTGAEKAGVKPGDVIVALDGTPIRSMDDLVLATRRSQVGRTVVLTIYRGGKKTQLSMMVGDKPTP
jgi:S1-C subfamily serine protease